MRAPTLFDLPPGAPFIAGSPTSHAAAEEIKPTAQNLRERVFACIADHPYGLNDEEIAELLRMNPSTERPRRIELQRSGRIRQDGTRMTKSGRQGVAWVAA